MHVWALWLSCETPAAPPDGPQGLAHDNQRTPNVHIERPSPSNTTKIPREDPEREERMKFLVGESIKARNFGPPPFGPPPSWPHPFGPPFGPTKLAKCGLQKLAKFGQMRMAKSGLPNAVTAKLHPSGHVLPRPIPLMPISAWASSTEARFHSGQV